MSTSAKHRESDMTLKSGHTTLSEEGQLKYSKKTSQRHKDHKKKRNQATLNAIIMCVHKSRLLKARLSG